MFSEATDSFIMTQFVLTVILNLALSGALTQMWNIFNTMQLISALPSFAIKTPANIEAIHSSFDEIINFEIFPKEFLYDNIVVPLVGFTNSEELFLDEVQTEIENEDAEPTLEKEEGSEEASIERKFQGTNVLMNIIFFILLLIFVAIVIGLVCICRSFVLPYCCRSMRTLC